MKVLQIIDSLDTGGAERMAVQIANELQIAGHDSHLCITRKEGLLKETVNEKVGYIFLEKKGKIGLKAMTKLKTYVVKNKIEVIHAHSTSFFTATVIKWWQPSIKLVWHDHYGNAEEVASRPIRIIKKCSQYFNGIISVNEQLKTWAIENLKKSPIIYLRNFTTSQKNITLDEVLPGQKGKRIIHLANLRPQKDHITLIKAFKSVINQEPDWSLLLVGMNFKDDYYNQILNKIESCGLKTYVHLLGSRNDTAAILEEIDIAVLSSKSEGLPVALLEYGMAGLPVVVTDVGACKEVVLDYGRVVPSGDSLSLSQSLLDLIQNKEKAITMGESFQKHVMTTFGASQYLNKLEQFYRSL